MPKPDRFCIVCGVSLDLHPNEGEGDDLAECGVAARRAELLTHLIPRPHEPESMTFRRLSGS